MVCYIIPLATAVVLSILWGFSKGGAQGFWLNLSLYGGAVFGVVDHLWHGELFLISPNWFADIALGATITGAIFGVWGLTLGLVKIKPSLAYRTGILRENKK
ncbi:MAG: hypothetical protein H3Z53_06635 [archaeon]|nr:hypothetical protein [archaeon]